MTSTQAGARSAPWLDLAWREQGQHELAGGATNPAIAAYFRDAGHPEIKSDETAWCAAFVGACLVRCSLTPTGSLMARSYLQWGRALAGPCVGAIAVLRRGNDPSAGHVGFVVRWDGSTVWLLGGNQGDEVKVAAFRRLDVIEYRWPEESTDVPAPASATAAEWAAGTTVATAVPASPRTGAALAALGVAGWARIAAASRTIWSLLVALVMTAIDLVQRLLDAAPAVHSDAQGLIDPVTSLLGMLRLEVAPIAITGVAALAIIVAALRHVDIKHVWQQARGNQES